MLSYHRARFGAALLAGFGAVATVAGCVAPSQEARSATTPRPSDATEHGPAGTGGVPAGALPSSHVHGVGVNPADGLVYLATHDGLFRYGPEGPERVGPVIDLMGFAVAGPDQFFSSGHPGPGVDLPQPLGLAQSNDGGQTWTAVSRGGESDFHALTASTAGVFGYDGFALRSTSDAQTWTELDPPVAPFAIAASIDGRVVVLTSSAGVYRSVDGGASWGQVEAPLLQYVAFADETVAVGVTPDGTVTRSEDAGQTWTQVGALGEPVAALAAARSGDGGTRVVVVTADRVMDSRDGGATFEQLPPG